MYIGEMKSLGDRISSIKGQETLRFLSTGAAPKLTESGQRRGGYWVIHEEPIRLKKLELGAAGRI